ncbi:hypothetical protein HPG69_019819 [Diceros bicornis minor]|uniref:Uncharacterized protein n=1 Tax=Diceros bicornis minor TaxID=77932 RepID=A0A7J7EQS2_DICBM|nr:hypothetical protein HPG69_019819 [Diceros bicornis minor]
MEFKAVLHVQYLPYLPSSNLPQAILSSNDETIDFSWELRPFYNEEKCNVRLLFLNPLSFANSGLMDPKPVAELSSVDNFLLTVLLRHIFCCFSIMASSLVCILKSLMKIKLSRSPRTNFSMMPDKYVLNKCLTINKETRSSNDVKDEDKATITRLLAVPVSQVDLKGMERMWSLTRNQELLSRVNDILQNQNIIHKDTFQLLHSETSSKVEGMDIGHGIFCGKKILHSSFNHPIFTRQRDF